LPRQPEQDDRHSSGWFVPYGLRLAPLTAILIALVAISAATGHTVVWLWIPLLFVFWRMTGWRRRRSWVGPHRGPDTWI
jgi:hypothetical protein